MARKYQQFTWADFPPIKDEAGYHCRYCKKLLSGRKRSWCGKACEKAVLLLVHWGYIRRCILRRDKYTCKLCGAKGYEVDHIVELADGGSFHDWANLRVLCDTCHKTKTAAARTARAKFTKKRSNAVSDSQEQPMEIVHFHNIKIGETFVIDGERFTKHDEMIYTDAFGFQHYIDPLFDVKIGKWLSEKVEAPKTDVDTSARIEKTE